MTTTTPHQAASLPFWQGRWQTGATGWDLGGPHPLLAELVAEARSWHALEPGARILEPGCGRAHGGAAMARDGYEVVSFDGVQEAVDAARAVYGEVPRLTIARGDALGVNPEWRGAFDAVLDRAMLCALPPEVRRPYIQACFEHLRPGGAFLSLLFTKVQHADPEKLGPPFAITLEDLSQLTTPFFSLQFAEERDPPYNPVDVIRREALVILRRRPRALIESSR
jgi:SAM-dependent methyltransferase